MPNLDQQRATLAFQHVTNIAAGKDAGKRNYGSMVHAMPALLRSAGLSQALHFVHTRSSDDQKILLAHIADQLRRVDPTIRNADGLLARVREAPLASYLRLTHEAHACMNWYRRFVQGVLKVEPGEDDAKDS